MSTIRSVPHRAAAVLAVLTLAFALLAGGWPGNGAQKPFIHAELHSWIVLGWGRHLYVQIDAPPPYEDLSGRVEFTSIALRDDYDPSRDTSGRPRLGRMTIGRHLKPMIAEANDRLESVLTLTLSQARCLARDRIFASPYVLVTTNSNASMRRVLESCGCSVPMRLARSGGLLGEFPGIDVDPGPELPAREWARFGLTNAP